MTGPLMWIEWETVKIYMTTMVTTMKMKRKTFMTMFNGRIHSGSKTKFVLGHTETFLYEHFT